ERNAPRSFRSSSAGTCSGCPTSRRRRKGSSAPWTVCWSGWPDREILLLEQAGREVRQCQLQFLFAFHRPADVSQQNLPELLAQPVDRGLRGGFVEPGFPTDLFIAPAAHQHFEGLK